MIAQNAGRWVGEIPDSVQVVEADKSGGDKSATVWSTANSSDLSG